MPLTEIRRNHGLHWHGAWPGLAEMRKHAKSVVLLALIVIAYGIAGRLDYEEELRQEAESQRTKAAIVQANLTACLNGRATGIHHTESDGRLVYVVCDPAWELDIGKVTK